MHNSRPSRLRCVLDEAQQLLFPGIRPRRGEAPRRVKPRRQAKPPAPVSKRGRLVKGTPLFTAADMRLLGSKELAAAMGDMPKAVEVTQALLFNPETTPEEFKEYRQKIANYEATLAEYKKFKQAAARVPEKRTDKRRVVKGVVFTAPPIARPAKLPGASGEIRVKGAGRVPMIRASNLVPGVDLILPGPEIARVAAVQHGRRSIGFGVVVDFEKKTRAGEKTVVYDSKERLGYMEPGFSLEKGLPEKPPPGLVVTWAGKGKGHNLKFRGAKDAELAELKVAIRGLVEPGSKGRLTFPRRRSGTTAGSVMIRRTPDFTVDETKRIAHYLHDNGWLDPLSPDGMKKLARTSRGYGTHSFDVMKLQTAPRPSILAKIGDTPVPRSPGASAPKAKKAPKELPTQKEPAQDAVSASATQIAADGEMKVLGKKRPYVLARNLQDGMRLIFGGIPARFATVGQVLRQRNGRVKLSVKYDNGDIQISRFAPSHKFGYAAPGFDTTPLEKAPKKKGQKKKTSAELTPAKRAAAAQKFRDAAKAREEEAGEAFERGQAYSGLRSTHKRRTAAAQAGIDAMAAERQARVFKALAAKMEAGTLTGPLAKVRTPTDVDAISWGVMPTMVVNKAWVQEMIDAIKGRGGIPELRKRLIRALPTTDYGYAVQLPKDMIPELQQALRIMRKKGADKLFTRELATVVRDYNRMAKLGITSEEDLVKARKELGALAKSAPPDPERERQQAIQDAEMKIAAQKIPGFFPTPPATIAKMLEMAEVQPGQKVLEPSAGKGDILAALKSRGIDATAIEFNQDLRNLLKMKGYNVSEDDDFLKHSGKYDRIIMNPPFEKGQDMTHVKHAFKLLKPGGRLVSVMSRGPFFRSDKKAQAFRSWVEKNGGHVEEQPDDTFKSGIRPTGVATNLLVLDKGPAESLNEDASGIGLEGLVELAERVTDGFASWKAEMDSRGLLWPSRLYEIAEGRDPLGQGKLERRTGSRLLGVGQYRVVFGDGKHAVKVSHGAPDANLREACFWERARDIPELRDVLVPVKCASTDGAWLVMEQADPFRRALTELPSLPGRLLMWDLQPANFGLHEGSPKLIDYADGRDAQEALDRYRPRRKPDCETNPDDDECDSASGTKKKEKLEAVNLGKVSVDVPGFMYGFSSGAWHAVPGPPIPSNSPTTGWRATPDLNKGVLLVWGATVGHSGFRNAYREMIAKHPGLRRLRVDFEGTKYDAEDLLRRPVEEEPPWSAITFYYGANETDLEVIDAGGLSPESVGSSDPVVLTTKLDAAKEQALSDSSSTPVVLEIRGIDQQRVVSADSDRAATPAQSFAQTGTIGYTGIIPARQVGVVLHWSGKEWEPGPPKREDVPAREPFDLVPKAVRTAPGRKWRQV